MKGMVCINVKVASNEIFNITKLCRELFIMSCSVEKLYVQFIIC